MCTVTYLPLNDGYIITSNRDEKLVRIQSEYPRVFEVNGEKILFPRDGEKGGTWIASSEKGRTLCLLNGAFLPHTPHPPYRKSRGLVVLDFFEMKPVQQLASNAMLDDIEPFTLLIAENKLLFELRWDGYKKYFIRLNETEAQIRSSVTLYSAEVIALRERLFRDWLAKHNQYRIYDILQFHLFTGTGDAANDLTMSRGGIVKTVSITSTIISGDSQNMYYSDLKTPGKVEFLSTSFDSSSALPNLSVTP